MKRLKCKTIALFIVVSMVASMFVGCGTNDTNVEQDITQEEVIEAATDDTASSELDAAIQAEEEAKKAEEEAKKAEEEAKKVEEAAKKAEEEAEAEEKAKAEEDRKKAEAEAKKAEEDRLKAEAEAKKAEEDRKKAEAEAKKAEEDRLKEEEQQKIDEQMNSITMLYYLAITAEDISTSKNNRLILDDIYTSLLNDLNPGAIDDETQDHLDNLRNTIKKFISINTKRERLQFIYNQQKAAAIRSAVPNPLAVFSATNSMDWKKLAVNVVYTAVDSYTNYKSASENADMEFLMSGWDLDDEEVEAVQKNRDHAFNYMVDIVQKYHLDGKLTLNEEAIRKFAEICDIESVPERIRRLNSEKETYKLLGNYWLELADCYFETSKYDKCLECVEEYQKLSTEIFRTDYDYAQILPKAIVAAQNTYSGNKYEEVVSGFVKDLVDNTKKEEKYWSTRYFAAQVYLDLYAKTNKKVYMEQAYEIAYDNVTLLLQKQRDLNNTYLGEVKEVTVPEPDYRYLTEKEKKEKKEQYSQEKKQAKNYNKALKESRKKELPSVYEPLAVNCELLFALANKINISSSEKADIEAIMQTASNGTFIIKPINDIYSFSNKNSKYSASVTKDEIIIPANLLSAEAKVSLVVNDGSASKTYTDCEIKKVERKGTGIENFSAYISSDQYNKTKWNKNSKVKIVIKYSDVYDKEYVLYYKVGEFESHWYGDKVVFVQE